MSNPTGGPIGGPLLSCVWDDATRGVRYTVAKYSETNSKGDVGLSGAITETQIGILQGTPDQGETCSVQIAGISYALAGGVIAKGDRVKVTTGGKLIADNTRNATVPTSMQWAFGIAWSAAAADGDLFTVIIRPSETSE